MSSSASFKEDVFGDQDDKKRNHQKKITSSKRTLIQIHFETVIILLRLKMNSIEKSLFLLFILTFLMSVTILNNYMAILQIQYPNIDTSTATFSLMSSLRYIDIAELLSYEQIISQVGAILCSIYIILMSLLYITCLVDRLLNPKSKARKYFFGRWFTNLQTFFIQLLSFPFGVIFLSYLMCTPEILGKSSADDCSTSRGMSNAVQSFSIIGIILLIISDVWIQIFFNNSKIYKKDSTCIERDGIFLLEWSIYKWILTFFTAVKYTESYSYYILFLIIEASASFYLYIRINYTMASFTYANSSFRRGNGTAVGFLLALHFALLLDELCRTSEYYSDQNEKIILFLVIITLLLYLITSPLKEIQLHYKLFSQKEISKLSQQSLLFQISLFQRLNSQSGIQTFSDAIFKGIVNNHLEKPCPHSNITEQCFCKQKILYDPKKRKDTPLDRIFYSQNNSVFTKFLIKSWYETYLFSHPNDYFIYLAYAEFLYFKMKNVSLAIKNITILDNKQISQLFSFRLFKLKEIILKHNRKRNHDSYRLNQSDKDNRNKLEIESVVSVEGKISDIQSGIKFIIKNNIHFWAYLEKSGANLNEINQLAKFSLRQLDALKKLWKDCMYYLDYRKKWRFYFCWYYLYILNKKVKVAMLERFNGITNLNENDVFSEEMVQDNIDDDIVSVHSNLKVEEMEKIYIKKVEMAFDKKNVVFNVNHEYKGKILKVSRGIYHVFGYTQIELNNQVYIQMLMPRIFQNAHPTLMSNFAQTGKTKTLYSQRKIFCLNKKGGIFSAWKFVKQFVTLAGRCEYVAMIRPILYQSGVKIYYIIINDDWEIDSMSEDIYEGLGILPNVYQNQNSKMILNLLVLAPKLIRFSKFAKYLTEADYKTFQNRESEKQKLVFHNINYAMPIIQGAKGSSRFSLLAKFKKDQFHNQLSSDSRDSTLIQEIDSMSPHPIIGGKVPLAQMNVESVFKKLGLAQKEEQDKATASIATAATTAAVATTSATTTTAAVATAAAATTTVAATTVVAATVAVPVEMSLSMAQEQSQYDSFQSANNNLNEQNPLNSKNLVNRSRSKSNTQKIPSLPFMQEHESMSNSNSNNKDNNQSSTPIININMPVVSPKSTPIVRRQAGKKRTIISSSIPDFHPMDEHEEHHPIPTSSDNDPEKNLLLSPGMEPMTSVDPRSGRRSSTIDMIEQLNFGQNQQFLETNFIRAEILKKKSVLSAQASLIEEQSSHESKTSEFELESQSSFSKQQQEMEEEEESEEAEFQKLDHLEKGDQIGFRIRLPFNLIELANNYNQNISQLGKRKSRIAEQQTVGSKQQKQFQTVSTTANMQLSNDQQEKKIYNIIKENIIQYQLKKSLKEFNATCTASFKKINKQKVIILKLTKFDETLKKVKNNAKNILKENNLQEEQKITPSLTSGQIDNLIKQGSQNDTILSKLNQFISMRSELSDARDSIHTITQVGRLGGKNDAVNSDNMEELTGVKNFVPNIGKMNGMGYQLSSVKEIQEDQAMNSERSMKTFHKDFVNRQGAKNISLGTNVNIYIKEDNHKPNKEIKTILNMKLFVRSFFLILISLNTFTFLYGPNYEFPILLEKSNKIFSAKNVLLSELQAYNLVLDQIAINKGFYDSSISSSTYWNSASYSNLVKNQFNQECSYFYNLSSDTSYRSTFFDKGITPYVSFNQDTFTESPLPAGVEQIIYSLDTYDLFSRLIFYLQTIQEDVFSTLNLNLQEIEFLRENTFPSIYSGLNTAQVNLVKNLKETTTSVYSFILIILIVDSVLVASSFLVLFHLIFVICNAFKSVIEVFPKISQRDLRKIKNYNLFLNSSFNYITEKDDLLSGTHPIFSLGMNTNPNGTQGKTSERDVTENGKAKKQADDYNLEEPSDGTENVGKKSKDIEEGGFLKELKMRIFTLYGIFVICVGLFTGIFLFLILQSTNNLQLILDNGDVFMNSFGANIGMMIAIKEKALDPDHYNTVLKENIQSAIDTFIASNMQPHVESLSFMNFDDMFNEIYYGNPCYSLADLFTSGQSTSTECSNLAQGSLGKGVASFGSFYKNAISEFVNNLSSDILDFQTIFDYNRGIFFVDQFQVYLVEVWSSNTKNYLTNQLSIVTAFFVIMLLVLFLVYLILTERLLIGRFTDQYSYFRTIYNMYMPDIIILKEKRIKFWLVKHFVLNK